MITRFSSNLKMRKGGEMMKKFGFALGLLVALSGACVADSVAYDVYDGWQLVAAPLVPFEPDAALVFANAADYTGWDPTTGGLSYGEGFMNVLLGDGYWLYSVGDTQVSYNGVADGVPDGSGNRTDMWISLPGDSGDGADAGGWHIIGYPFASPMDTDSGANSGDQVFFTDGTSLKNWSEAAAANWVEATMSGYSPAQGGGFTVVYDDSEGTKTLAVGNGYWIRTLKDNLAMILNAQYSN